MKYICLTITLAFIPLYGMQRLPFLQILASEEIPLTRKHIQNASIVLKGLSKKNCPPGLATKALWGLAAAWNDSFDKDGEIVARILVKAGADLQEPLLVEDVVFLQKRRMSCGTYTTTILEAAHSMLKNHLLRK